MYDFWRLLWKDLLAVEDNNHATNIPSPRRKGPGGIKQNKNRRKPSVYPVVEDFSISQAYLKVPVSHLSAGRFQLNHVVGHVTENYHRLLAIDRPGSLTDKTVVSLCVRVSPVTVLATVEAGPAIGAAPTGALFELGVYKSDKKKVLIWPGQDVVQKMVYPFHWK